MPKPSTRLLLKIAIGLFIKMCEKAISQVDAGRINIQTAAYAIFGLQVYPELYEHSEVTRRIFDLSASLELPEGHMPSNADELWREFLQCVSDMKKTAA